MVNPDQIWQWLAAVPDPEIPAISVVDLGIVRDVACHGHGVHVTVTPTYSGCPATAVIARDIQAALRSHGLDPVSIETRLSPPWTTDWVTPAGREKLRQFGIAPPPERLLPVESLLRPATADVACPHCGARRTVLTSQFGSTPCKALYRCSECLEPFDFFKPH